VKNKKGFLRIIEAVLAIMIILGVLIIVAGRNQIRTEVDLSESISPYLDEIAKDATLRDQIIRGDVNARNNVFNFLDLRITNPSLGFDVVICEPADPCSLDAYPGDASQGLFAGERVISSTLPTYDPKKVKVFLWIKD